MFIGQEFYILGDWFRIHFIENEGMAFGVTLGGNYGKLLLTVFRILMVFFIGYLIRQLLQRSASASILLSFSLIFAGALGNIIDSIFYGVLFSESSFHARNIAEFLPKGGGYAPLFHGKVVDMLYFPLYEGFLPAWIPFVGGDFFVFFRPVFNIADAAISVGVAVILLFQRHLIFSDELEPSEHEAKPHYTTPNDTDDNPPPQT